MFHDEYTKIYDHISNKIGINVQINPELCFYTPSDVVNAIQNNHKVTTWLKYISNHYVPEKKDILLIYPCSTIKPYSESRSYKILNKTLDSIGKKRNRVHVMTISEPFGLVPEEFYGVNTKWHDWENDWYDCPGLFEWWCNRNKVDYDASQADIAIDLLSSYLSDFFKKVDRLNIYKEKIALVRTYTSNLEQKKDHTHRRMIESAIKKSNTRIQVIPDNQIVKDIVAQRGAFAWDMWGVAHPMVQSALKKQLSQYLS